MSNPVQPLDPMSPPDAVTPADAPSNPAGYAQVTPHGQGPAPYDIQAPAEDLTGAYGAAGAVAGAGVVYGEGPRQAQTERLLSSAPGYGAQDITAGFAGGGGESWPANPNPVVTAQTPDQGTGDFQGTMQEGVQKYGTS